MPLFSDLANAALSRGLPAIESWLRERLGDDAQIERLSIGNERGEGSRVLIDGAILPLGARMRIDGVKASVAVVPRGLSSPRIFVTSAEGELRVRGGGRTLTARLELADGRDDGDTWVSGELVVRACRISDASCGLAVELSGKLTVRLTPTRWELRGTVAGDGVALDVEVDGRLGSTPGRRLRAARIRLREGSLGQVADLGACWVDLGVSAAWPLPWEASGKGEIGWLEDVLDVATEWRGAQLQGGRVRLPSPLEVRSKLRFGGLVEGEAAISSARSSLRIAPFRYGARRLDGTRCNVDLALADARGVSSAALMPTARGSLRGELALEGELGAWKLGGDLSADLLELEAAARPSLPVLVADRLSGVLSLSPAELTVERLAFDAYGTRFGGAVRLPFTGAGPDPLLTLRFVDADAKLIAAVAGLGGRAPVAVARSGARPPGERWLPPEVLSSGEVHLHRDGAIAAEVAFEGPAAATALMLTLALSSDRRLGDTRLRGRIETHHLALLGLFDGPIAAGQEVPAMARTPGDLRPTPGHGGQPWRIDAELEGSLDAPAATVRVDAERTTLVLWKRLELPLEGLRAHLHVDAESLVWKQTQARVFGGLVTTEGVLGFSAAFAGLDCHFAGEDVRIGDLSIADRPVSEHLEGRMGARMHLRRHRGALTGEATIEVADPRYHLVAHAKRPLKDLGLPPPPVHGVGPLVCRVDLDDSAARVADLNGRLEGVELAGSGRIGYDGTLEGTADIRLSARYLKKSPLFVVPAALAGGLKLPVRISGTVSAPRFHARIAEALREKLDPRRVSSAIRGAAEEAADAIDSLFGSFRSKRPPQPRHDPDLDAIVERCLADDPDDDLLVDRLIDAGVSADDIVRVVERRGKQ